MAEPTYEQLAEAVHINTQLADVVGSIEAHAENLPSDVALWAAVSMIQDVGDHDPHYDELVRIAVTAVIDTRKAVKALLASPVIAAEQITQE